MPACARANPASAASACVEEPHRVDQPCVVAAVAQLLQPFQVSVVGVELVRGRQPLRQRRALARQHAQQRLHHLVGDLALHGEYVGRVAFVGVAPQGEAARRVRQPRVDAHARAVAPHAGVEHRRHAQGCAPSALMSGAPCAAGVRCNAGGDLQPRHPGQRVVHLHRQAFGEIAVVAVVAQAGEGQHRDRGVTGARRWRLRAPGQYAQHGDQHGRRTRRPPRADRPARAMPRWRR